MSSDQPPFNPVSSMTPGPRRAEPPRRLDLDLGDSIRPSGPVSSGVRDAGDSYESDEHETPEEQTPMHPSFQTHGGDFISSGPQPGHAARPSIDGGNPYLPTQLSQSTLTQQPPTGYTTDSDALARAQTNFSAHSRTPLKEPASAFPGVDENGRIRVADFASHDTSGTNTPEHPSVSHHVHYPPIPDPEQHYTTVPLDGHAVVDGMDEKYGTTGSNSSGKKKGVLFGNAKRWSHGAQKDVELAHEKRPQSQSQSRSASWDLLRGRGSRPSSIYGGSGANTPAGGRSGSATPRVEWEGFDFNTANSSVEQLRFAEGDVGKGKLLWIPGIIWLAGVRHARVWGVDLLYWSIWLTIVWAGWWAALAAAMMLPHFIRVTLGTIVPGARAYVDIFRALTRNVAFCLWSLAIWVSFQPLLKNTFVGDTNSTSYSDLNVFQRLIFGLFIVSLITGGEKIVIQLIAYRFHQDSYEDRIREQKLNIKSIVTLYINSHDTPGRSDTLTEAIFAKEKKDPRRALKKALKGLRNAAQTTTTALGNVATEISGQSVLQTNSPYNRVNVALGSAQKSKMLARRLYYSFKKADAECVTIGDIARYFPDRDSALVAFSIFDRDDNGDATRDEFEMATMQLHREKLALEASMRDLDGAVRRLDDILMVIVFVIACLIFATMLSSKISTFVTSASSFILGLSWLIGTTMQEILGASIFLFVKHPFDVGDRVDIDGQSYTVANMALMSTAFRRVDGTYVWIGNDILRSKIISNVRRSGPISETITFEVDFGTDFKKLQELRDQMLIFLHTEKRDYSPVFDVVVDDFPAQGKLVLKADIKYRSNWQEGALKVQRRNKWICALKQALKDCSIFGPGDAGNPSPPPADPVRYMQVPFEALPADAADEDRIESPPPDFLSATQGAQAGAALMDRDQVIHDTSADIYDDHVDLQESSARSGAYGAADNDPAPPAFRQRLAHARVPGEEIEMAPTRLRA
ncbi:hypothetical protein QFC19_003888 [Naganishia cerealis]|uniref:Uncharacterized protein n=1 Tax=Naganishia cerealis TaxID=610337 RepID=A0ACC2W278_9TREE|nr:hypothetical protein QFC19_003888 [Naganishia cerealis]